MTSHYSKRDWQGARLFHSILKLLHIDVTLEPTELLHKVIYWFNHHKVLIEVTKPGELAFSIPQIFYHYNDVWEVNNIFDFSLFSISSFYCMGLASTASSHVRNQSIT